MASNPKHANSVVFVGNQFQPSMFDERSLFGGNIDPDQLRAGPISQFSYSSGTFQFVVVPERIDLKCNGTEIVPDDLVNEAKTIIAEIQPARKAVKVTGIGMNCDTVFDHRDIGMTGIKFCNRLIHAPRMHKLIGESRIIALERMYFTQGALQIDVRIEPHIDSNGR